MLRGPECEIVVSLQKLARVGRYQRTVRVPRHAAHVHRSTSPLVQKRTGADNTLGCPYRRSGAAGGASTDGVIHAHGAAVVSRTHGLVNPRASVEEYLRWLSSRRAASRDGRSVRRPGAIRRMARDSGPSSRSTHPDGTDGVSGGTACVTFATSSVNRHWSSIRGLLRYLANERVISVNPAASLASGRRPKSCPSPSTKSLVVRLIHWVSGDTALARRDRALLELLYGTGARVSRPSGLNSSTSTLTSD